jgi:hypothetical protein
MESSKDKLLQTNRTKWTMILDMALESVDIAITGSLRFCCRSNPTSFVPHKLIAWHSGLSATTLAMVHQSTPSGSPQ